MTSVLVWIRRNLSALIHPRVRSFILRRVSVLDQRTRWWESKDPYRNDPPYSTDESQYPVTLGIFKEFWHRHWPYVAACRDLGVVYRVVDISGPDWKRNVDESGCDAFLVWPSVQVSIWKQMFDERLKVISEDMKKVIYPNYNELWVYESKRRMGYWLAGNDVPHPKTWVFYSAAEALAHCRTAELPVVAKSNMGARSSGVRIFRRRSALIRHAKRAFGPGFIHNDGDARDPDWGSLLLQEFLPNVQEWRMRRIGDSYFGSQKLRRGDFHSGTGVDVWYDPPKKLLDFTREITDHAGSRSMSLDIFETVDGRYLVNELQTVFGTALPYEMLVNGKAGRYLYNGSTGDWRFEEGIFCQNGCCNLRVADVLKALGHTVALPPVDIQETLDEGDREASLRDYAAQMAQSQHSDA